MSDARVVLDSLFPIGEVNRRLFGSLVEHMGRCVYGGIYEPDHPLADKSGLRKDVLELTAELVVTTVRYPGGNLSRITGGRTASARKGSGRCGVSWRGGRSRPTSSA